MVTGRLVQETTWQQLSSLLLDLGKQIRSGIIRGRDLDRDALEIGYQGGDVIYAIDKRVEPIVLNAIGAWPAELLPLTLVMEGLESPNGIHIGPKNEVSRFRLLIDPIDGTRCLMYDKRSAWFLAAAAIDKGATTRLADAGAAVMVELPTSKHGYADSYASTAGGRMIASRSSMTGNDLETPIRVRPSAASSLVGGFGQVSLFLPGTKELGASLMEHLVRSTAGELQPGTATVFDDQYLSTGGQMIELLSGKDRFCCDLRPLFYQIQERELGRSVPHGLECHPYDLAGSLVARSAGVILTDGFGQELDAPFDLTTGVHWIGYANNELRRLIEPPLLEWLHGRLSGGWRTAGPGQQ